MKTAEIHKYQEQNESFTSSKIWFYHLLKSENGTELSEGKWYPAKEDVVNILKDQFPNFEIVDKTGEL